MRAEKLSVLGTRSPLDGRERQAGSAAERVRLAVTKRIKATLATIARLSGLRRITLARLAERARRSAVA